MPWRGWKGRGPGAWAGEQSQLAHTERRADPGFDQERDFGRNARVQTAGGRASIAGSLAAFSQYIRFRYKALRGRACGRGVLLRQRPMLDVSHGSWPRESEWARSVG